MLPIVENTNRFPIFPGLLPEIDGVIIEKLENLKPCSVVALSGVNRLAFTCLSNDAYFAPCVKRKYSPLFEESSPFEFKLLKQICPNPNSFHKVLFCSPIDIGLWATKGFMRSGIPFFRDFFQDSLAKAKESAEVRLKEICGSGYEDPYSPIHVAWRQSQQGLQLHNGYLRLEIKRLDAVQIIENANNELELLKDPERFTWGRCVITHKESLENEFSRGIATRDLSFIDPCHTLLQRICDGSQELTPEVRAQIFTGIQSCSLNTRQKICSKFALPGLNCFPQILPSNVDQTYLPQCQNLKRLKDVVSKTGDDLVKQIEENNLNKQVKF